ncbi:Barwin-like endoglucanase [Pleurostoma richardsiae]|uniref:cellulase n=1 Tax=Pleurostoma richardsiae TaxID=41990 RepID=A0AA38RDD6_9PEZI|nr:Barwin-like endoglucanase [Pleurostoma richardsiae]
MLLHVLFEALLHLLFVSYVSGLAAVSNGTGITTTTWDCCKPACAWTTTARTARANGTAAVCDKDDRQLSVSQGQSAQSGCSTSPGTGYLCSSYQPKPMTEDLSYGFVVSDGAENCCKCFELQWQGGPAAGKKMQVQIINEGGSANGTDQEFIIVTPGGGSGPNLSGCKNQYGSTWGRNYGGVLGAGDCESLPDNLQGGCYWRFNWARGDINNWPITWTKISCPGYFTSISGCNNIN